MKKLLSLGILFASIVAAPLVAHADSLDGTGGISLLTTAASCNPCGLNTAGIVLSFSNGGFTGTGTGDFTLTSAGSYIFPSLYVDNPLGGASGAFTVTIGGWGTFTETASLDFVTRTANNLDVYMVGDFVPDTDTFPGATSGPSSLRFSFTYTPGTLPGDQGSYSGSATFATPPAGAPNAPTVPEPSSLALLGTGLIGGVGMIRRRFKA